MMAEDNKETKKPRASKAKAEESAETEAKPKKAPAKKAAAETETAAKKAPAAKKTEKPAAEKTEKAAKPAAAKKEKAVKKVKKQATERLRLQDLKPNEGAKRLRKRVGRGRASGMGKTSTRGHNGEGQRAGRSSKRGFEGGQMPLYRKIPKINGFEIINTKNWFEISTKQLEKLATVHKTTDLTLAWFEENGFFNPKRQYGIRVYGNQPVNTAIKAEVHYATPAASEALKNAGGSLKLMPTAAESKAS